MTATPQLAELFKAWWVAETAAHYAEDCPDEIMDQLTAKALEGPAAMARIRATTTEELLLKLFPLLMASYEPHGDAPPMVPHYDYVGNGCRDLLSSVTDDLRQLCPAIAEAMAVPHRTAFRAMLQRHERPINSITHEPSKRC